MIYSNGMQHTNDNNRVFGPVFHINEYCQYFYGYSTFGLNVQYGIIKTPQVQFQVRDGPRTGMTLALVSRIKKGSDMSF